MLFFVVVKIFCPLLLLLLLLLLFATQYFFFRHFILAAQPAQNKIRLWSCCVGFPNDRRFSRFFNWVFNIVGDYVVLVVRQGQSSLP